MTRGAELEEGGPFRAEGADEAAVIRPEFGAEVLRAGEVDGVEQARLIVPPRDGAGAVDELGGVDQCDPETVGDEPG